MQEGRLVPPLLMFVLKLEVELFSCSDYAAMNALKRSTWYSLSANCEFHEL